MYGLAPFIEASADTVISLLYCFFLPYAVTLSLYSVFVSKLANLLRIIIVDQICVI